MTFKESDDGYIVIEDAEIIRKNFRGERADANVNGKIITVNKEGQRNFCVIFRDGELVKKLENEGWNFHDLEPRDEYDSYAYFLKVSVSYKNFPPKIYLVNSKGEKQLLVEDELFKLDNEKFKNVDLSISPYKWNVTGREGVKAYLRSMYITINEDELENKYADN